MEQMAAPDSAAVEAAEKQLAVAGLALAAASGAAVEIGQAAAVRCTVRTVAVEQAAAAEVAAGDTR